MPVVTKELTGKEKPEKYGDKERVWIVFLNPDAPIYCFSEPEIATAVARLRERKSRSSLLSPSLNLVLTMTTGYHGKNTRREPGFLCPVLPGRPFT